MGALGDVCLHLQKRAGRCVLRGFHTQCTGTVYEGRRGVTRFAARFFRGFGRAPFSEFRAMKKAEFALRLFAIFAV